MIPVVINNFNRLSTTRKLVEDLDQLCYWNVHIIDNGSTYPPLLEWYEKIQNTVTIHRIRNLGPRAIYDSGIIRSFQHLPWVAYTDSDIELNPNTPKGFIEHLCNKAEEWKYDKAGLALRLNDIEEHHFGFEWVAWEKKYWDQYLGDGVYHADVDTTFCVIRPTLPFDYRAIRVAGKLMARHIPWYTDFNNLSEEEQYYLDHSSDESTYKRCYKKVLSGGI